MPAPATINLTGTPVKTLRHGLARGLGVAIFAAAAIIVFFVMLLEWHVLFTDYVFELPLYTNDRFPVNGLVYVCVILVFTYSWLALTWVTRPDTGPFDFGAVVLLALMMAPPLSALVMWKFSSWFAKNELELTSYDAAWILGTLVGGVIAALAAFLSNYRDEFDTTSNPLQTEVQTSDAVAALSPYYDINPKP